LRRGLGALAVGIILQQELADDGGLIGLLLRVGQVADVIANDVLVFDVRVFVGQGQSLAIELQRLGAGVVGLLHFRRLHRRIGQRVRLIDCR
jgi:hypothetical protein